MWSTQPGGVCSVCGIEIMLSTVTDLVLATRLAGPLPPVRDAG